MEWQSVIDFLDQPAVLAGLRITGVVIGAFVLIRLLRRAVTRLGLAAAVTIMVGNWAAVTQTNSKRLLAYSSISNAGYLRYELTSLAYHLARESYSPIGRGGALLREPAVTAARE